MSGTHPVGLRAQYDSLPVSRSRNLIGRRPSVLRAFAILVGSFALSTLAYRLVVPLESASAEQWLLMKQGGDPVSMFHNLDPLTLAYSSLGSFRGSGDSSLQQKGVKGGVDPVVRKLMRVAANHIRIKSPPLKLRKKGSGEFAAYSRAQSSKKAM
jgi:hypothetical protein